MARLQVLHASAHVRRGSSGGSGSGGLRQEQMRNPRLARIVWASRTMARPSACLWTRSPCRSGSQPSIAECSPSCSFRAWTAALLTRPDRQPRRSCDRRPSSRRERSRSTGGETARRRRAPRHCSYASACCARSRSWPTRVTCSEEAARAAQAAQAAEARQEEATGAVRAAVRAAACLRRASCRCRAASYPAVSCRVPHTARAVRRWAPYRAL